MKVYFHLNIDSFTNTYLVANEKTNEAMLIDPGKITSDIIELIESNNFKLSGILITHNHESHTAGLKTLEKIYTTRIFAADFEIYDKKTTVLAGDGKLKIAGLTVQYLSLPGHTADSIIFKIGNIIFTGDSLSAGELGTTNSSYSNHILHANIESKILSQVDNTVLMPGHGPPTTVGAEKKFNININYQR